MKLKKVIFLFIMFFSANSLYANIGNSVIQGETKYRIEKLESDNVELKKKIEEVEKNSRTAEQFKSVLDIHEKSMNSNDRNMTLLSVLIGFISIFIPVVGYFWNKKFMSDIEKDIEKIRNNAKEISKEFEDKLKDYDKQVGLLLTSSKLEKEKEMKNIAQQSYPLGKSDSINSNDSTNSNKEYQRDLLPTKQDNDSSVETDPLTIKENQDISAVYDKMNQARIDFNQDKKSQALSKYNEIIEQYKNSENTEIKRHVANAYFNRGVIFADQGKFEEAVNEYNHVIENFSDDLNDAIKFSRIKSFINKLSLLLTTQKYKDAISGYENFLKTYENDDDSDIKLAVIRAYYNYMIALWKESAIDKFIDTAQIANEKFQNEKEPFDIQVFLSRILNLLIFVLGEENRLSESVFQFRNFVLQFSREINPNIIFEIEKSFSDQIDLFTEMRNFNKLNEMCDIVLNNLQNNPKFNALVERARRIKAQIQQP